MASMKKLFLLGALIGINGLVYGTQIQDTFPNSGADALSGTDAYEWGISVSPTSGQTVTSATINFSDIVLTASGNNNGTGAIFTDLLNAGVTGLTTVSEGDTSYDYWTTKFSGANITQVGTTDFTLNVQTNFSYTLTTSQLNALNNYVTANNGVFDIGLDPNCHYSVGSITFDYVLGNTSKGGQEPVPDGAETALLLLAGLAGLEGFRRRLALAQAKS